ncbi:MAG: cytochrome c [bacterium]|nr:cytochrome c [bacterium]
MNPLKFQKQLLLAVLSSLTSFCLVSCGEKELTFSKDIAPIVYKNCTPCHQPNGGAPFNLISYTDVAKRAKTIAFVTRTGYMPPWPADRLYTHFLNERLLSESEIELIQKWATTGKSAGDTNQLKPMLSYKRQSVLGPPDLVIDVPPVTIENNNTDRFYLIKIPYQIKQAQYVKSVEFVAGQPSIVHHANGHLLLYDQLTNPFAGKRIIETNDSHFLAQFNRLELLNANGTKPERIHSAFNYLPGSFGVKYPNGIGGFILSPNGTFIANDIHYGPSKKALIDSSKLYVYFADKKPERPTFEIMLGTNGVAPIVPPLQIAPNAISKHITELTIYNDISVLTINPHMHLIGQQFKAYALKPNGDTVRLIKIPQWQFRWQYFYTFTKPVKIPKGSIIRVEAVFDNTIKNPNNPFNPPQLIGERNDHGGASMRTTDEMLQFILTYMPYQKGDELIDLGGK